MSGPEAYGEAPHRLDHLGDVFVTFNNGTFQWVDIKRFRLARPAAADRAVLAFLIEHDRYGDDYAGGGPGEDPARHGPYWRTHITAASFEPADAAVEEARLRAWAEQYAKLPQHLHTDLDRELYTPLRAADSIYRLRDLGKAALHDWGGVHNQFHELVLINRTAGTITLAVAADD